MLTAYETDRHPEGNGPMGTHRTLLVGVALGSLLAGPAGVSAAAPRVACNLVPDEAGDSVATAGVPNSAPDDKNDPVTDLLMVDLASDSTRITVVWRTNTLPPADPAGVSAYGYELRVNFVNQAKKTTLMVFLAKWLGSGDVVWQNDLGTGVVDVAKKELRMTVPLSALRDPNGETVTVGKGETAQDIVGKTSKWVQPARDTTVGGRTVTGVQRGAADLAQNGKTYLTGSKSCLKIGA
jgi:hypothetical protein